MGIDLSNKIALVTGGTKGIGRAIAESLVKAAANVTITARNEEEIGRTVSELKELGAAAGYVCDVRDYDDVKSIFANLEGLDLLINKAGVGIFASVESMSVD